MQTSNETQSKSMSTVNTEEGAGSRSSALHTVRSIGVKVNEMAKYIASLENGENGKKMQQIKEVMAWATATSLHKSEAMLLIDSLCPDVPTKSPIRVEEGVDKTKHAITLCACAQSLKTDAARAACSGYQLKERGVYFVTNMFHDDAPVYLHYEKVTYMIRVDGIWCVGPKTMLVAALSGLDGQVVYNLASFIGVTAAHTAGGSCFSPTEAVWITHPKHAFCLTWDARVSEDEESETENEFAIPAPYNQAAPSKDGVKLFAVYNKPLWSARCMIHAKPHFISHRNTGTFVNVKGRKEVYPVFGVVQASNTGNLLYPYTDEEDNSVKYMQIYFSDAATKFAEKDFRDFLEPKHFSSELRVSGGLKLWSQVDGVIPNTINTVNISAEGVVADNEEMSWIWVNGDGMFVTYGNLSSTLRMMFVPKSKTWEVYTIEFGQNRKYVGCFATEGDVFGPPTTKFMKAS